MTMMVSRPKKQAVPLNKATNNKCRHTLTRTEVKTFHNQSGDILKHYNAKNIPTQFNTKTLYPHPDTHAHFDPGGL